ncbi:hypothetical protein ACEPPZ_00415 [Paracoccus yeei]|uniref:hypothetical protein n=1 Tax=Paracoccus yeei TaxID=147645 RepID=UPI0028D211DA|nr:hypothetical protein [Paracoccus yeei]
MIWPLLLTAAVAGTPAPASADALIAQATEAMLAGEPMPADMEARMRDLPPAERLRVLVFLRRAGLFSGPEWPIDRVLAPAGQEKAP